MQYQIMVGSFDGFIKFGQFVQLFGGSIVTNPKTLGIDTVGGLFGEQEFLTVVIEVPELSVEYFEAFTKKIGLFDGEQMKRFEPATEAA